MFTSFDTMAEASRQTIPLSEPCLQGNEWAYIQQCLATNWVSSAGPFVQRFESDLAHYLGRPYAIATSSGTAALHGALLVAGIQPNDEVLVSTLSFIAPANAVRYCGAWPVFIDAEPSYWQMDPKLVEEFLTRQCVCRAGALLNRHTGRRVKAIVPVHVLGHPVEMAPILDLARRFGLTVIEDAAESLGAQYQGEKVGCFGDLACFSFNGNKTVTTGGGGMIVTSNEAWAAKARYLTTQAKDDAVASIHHEIGYNYRLPNLLAAVGCAQLEVLPKYIDAKRRIAALYSAALEGVPGITILGEAPRVSSTYWLSTIQVNLVDFGVSRREVHEQLRRCGIESRPLWQPLHRSRAHRGSHAIITGVADRLVENGLSLPSSVGLDDAQLTRVAREIAAMARRGAKQVA